jgi:mycothiol synthase
MAEYMPAEKVDQDALADMLARSARHDRDEILSEHKSIRIRGFKDSRAVVLLDGDSVGGYAQAAWHGPVAPDAKGHWAVEVVLDPDSRNDDTVAACVLALCRRLPDGDDVAVWSLVEYVASGLEAAGYSDVRRLLRMRRSLPAAGKPGYPPGVSLSAFTPGSDEDAWLTLNNAAFAGHPENGALDRDDMDERLARPWFDREGFLLAWDGSRLVGSCWTKVHADGVGEIYIIAVHPDERGRGLGTALLMSGMDYLHRSRGAASVFLYVEGDNVGAIAMYESAGFRVDRTMKQYRLQTL